jgi:hypothetical protein
MKTLNALRPPPCAPNDASVTGDSKEAQTIDSGFKGMVLECLDEPVNAYIQVFCFCKYSSVAGNCAPKPKPS